MSRFRLEHDSWVLVCDGRKALILQNVGDGEYPNLVVRQEMDHPDPLPHELGTDAPGRVFAGMGSRRGAVEEADPQAHAEKIFLHSVADNIGRRVGAGEIRKLIAVAPPRALGVLRNVMSPQVRNVVQNEIDKDYVRLPVYEIEKHLMNSGVK